VRPTTVLQDEEKCIFMKSAAEYGKSAPNGCFCRTKKNVFHEKGCSSRKQKNVFYEKRNSDWNICSKDKLWCSLVTGNSECAFKAATIGFAIGYQLHITMLCAE
jgi:hypothetical protein